MVDAPLDDDLPFEPRESPLSYDVAAYIDLLTERNPKTIFFRTGSGRFFRDLLLHWPVIDEYEDIAQLVCNKIVDNAYPLVASLFAQAVDMSIVISSAPLRPPKHIDALMTYMLFDPKNRVERVLFLSAKHALPSVDLLSAPKGVAVICKPINVNYHTLKDSRVFKPGTHAGIFEKLERIISEEYEKTPFSRPRDKEILRIMKETVSDLPAAMARYDASIDINFERNPAIEQRLQAIIPTYSSLSALPSPVLLLERQLMRHVTDRTLSQELRSQFRLIAQRVREAFPQAVFEEAERQQLIPAVTRTARGPTSTAPLPDQKPNLWIFPSPEPTPNPSDLLPRKK